MKMSLLLAISLLPLSGPEKLAYARTNPTPHKVQTQFPLHWYPSRVARMLKFLAKREVNHVVFLGMPEYPLLLAQEDNPPFRLFYRGRLPRQDEQLFSLCGTRRGDLGAESCSYELALEAAANRVGIITSHSQGMDRAALYAVHDSHSEAFVTCDCGLDTPRIMNNHLLDTMNLISAFEPDDPPLRYRCLSRNVLTAALSPLLVVMQAPQTSGCLHCARLALDMGRDVVVHHCGLKVVHWCSGSRMLHEEGSAVITGYAEIATLLGTSHRRKVRRSDSVGQLYRYGNTCYSLEDET